MNSLPTTAQGQDLAASSNTQSALPATLQTALQALPELPKHYNPIRALPEGDRAKLLDTVLAQYECGVSIYTLAEVLGVDNATLYRQLLKHRPEEWMEVRAARYHSQVEQAEKDMKEASDPLAVTRAREQLANARWMLERLQRKIYGQDQERQVGQAIQINIGIRRDAQTVENAE
jgi:DNA-binding ferritin-like protein (Dps family)